MSILFILPPNSTFLRQVKVDKILIRTEEGIENSYTQQKGGKIKPQVKDAHKKPTMYMNDNQSVKTL